MATDHVEKPFTHDSTSDEIRTENIGIATDIKSIRDKPEEDIIKIPNYEQLVLDAITEPPKIRNGVQVTDTTRCIRLKAFEFVMPKAQAPKDKVRLATGTGLHRYVQQKIRNPDPGRYDVELPVDYKGYVFGSIDLYDKKLKIIIDIKTKVVDGTWKIKPFPSEEEQLKDLMAMKNVSNGVLVLVLTGSNEPVKQFTYHMTINERQTQLKKLEEKATSYLNAKNNKDPYLAKHVFFDKQLNWLCHRIDRKTGEQIWCPYYWDCFSMIKRERDANENSQSTTKDPLDINNGDGKGGHLQNDS